jgi:hypothetical protein
MMRLYSTMDPSETLDITSTVTRQVSSDNILHIKRWLLSIPWWFRDDKFSSTLKIPSFDLSTLISYSNSENIPYDKQYSFQDPALLNSHLYRNRAAIFVTLKPTCSHLRQKLDSLPISFCTTGHSSRYLYVHLCGLVRTS